MDQLDEAIVQVQKLEKKLRQLVNRGEAATGEVIQAKRALEILRDLARGRGGRPPDIDSRGERSRARERRRREAGGDPGPTPG